MRYQPSNQRATVPFPALVGLELAQQALILLAIDPRLQGVVIAAPVGTGKSSLARGFQSIVTALSDADDETQHVTPFVEIPASIDAENLLGGLDLEATLRTGKVVMQRGVLARAHGGTAYVDGINLLPDTSVNLLLSVLDSGELHTEREGMSLHQPARFSLIGSYDPAEGLPRKHLLDRIGLIVPVAGQNDVEQRQMVLERNLNAQAHNWQDDIDFMRGIIATARDHLPNVTISDEDIRRLSYTALQYGVEGHRVDIFAMRAACAAAAFNLRDEVNDDDCALAVQLVILPRATRIPTTPPDEAPPQQPPDNQMADNAQDETPPPEPEVNDHADEENQSSAPPEQLGIQPEQILEAIESQLPEDLETLPFQHLRRGRTGSRGSTEGTRGRHVRSIPGDPKRARIDVIATLRAAAPYQPLRRKRYSTRRKTKRYRVQLRLSDVRVKQYRSKAGALFCFLVDASGSMALHRMRQAKGAINTLLEKAYVNRDRVALIAFRGEKAELLLPPSQSVELAHRALDLLPTGGGTPLASALLLADDVAEQARSRGILQTVLIILTDGRANISLREGQQPQEELKQIGAYLAQSRLHTIVVDTKRSYLSRGEARQLAEWLGGDYAYLPNADSGQIVSLATEAIETTKA